MATFSNKTEILNLIKTFMHSDFDEDSISDIYSEVLQDIAQSSLHPLVDWSLSDVVTGQHTYPYPASAIKILAAFHKAKQLNFVDVKQLEAYSMDWRSSVGDALAYLQEEQSAREIRLFPSPAGGGTIQDFEFIDTTDFVWQNTTDFIWQQTPRLKELAFFFSETRDTKIPEWAVLFILFEILARETSHPGEQQDLAFAEACQNLANLLATF